VFHWLAVRWTVDARTHPDDGADNIIVPKCIFQRLQDDDADAFASPVAICATVKAVTGSVGTQKPLPGKGAPWTRDERETGAGNYSLENGRE